MNENFWNDLGNDLLSAVNDAVTSGDFSNLSENVNQALSDVKSAAASAQQNYVKYHQPEKWKVVDEPKPKPAPKPKPMPKVKNTAPAIYRKNVPGQYKGPAYTAIGATFTGIFGTAALVLAGFALAGTVPLVSAVVFGVLTAPFVIMFSKGKKHLSRNGRFLRYKRVIGERSYCKIEDLARAVNKKPKYVLRDLKNMCDLHYFTQAHIDASNQYLLVTDEAYDQYQQAENSRREREAAELEEKNRQAAEAAANKEMMSGLSLDVQKLLEEGNQYIAHIHECNDAIPGEVMSAKLARLEDTVRRIFEQVKRQPDSASELRKMMSYYLPTTTKLIDSYRDLDGQPEYGNNIANTKKEIEATLDTINEAFENLFDSLFENTAFDIASDIATMKTVMAQEGLTTNNDFVKETSR